MRHILTVCAGNICRSPIAAAMLARDLPDKTTWSAGLGAMTGRLADPLSIEVAALHGLDLSAHRAQQITSWMCQGADLILVMERAQKIELERAFPIVRGKVFRLGEVGNFDVADPYGQPKAAFELAYTYIARGVTDWVSRIRKL